MNTTKLVENFKPYFVGGVVGAIAITIVGFTTGFVVTQSAMADGVRDAQINLVAEVCREQAVAHLQTQGFELASLSNTQERRELAEQFVPAVANDLGIQRSAINRCNSLLRS